MAKTHILGYPRIGAHRELKRAQEAYWKGEIDQQALLAAGAQVRSQNWQAQQAAGLALTTVGDFAWYDQVLNHSLLFGVIPERFQHGAADNKLDQYFRLARGRAPSGEPVAASAMTKWFDTNYHYLVPEFSEDQPFTLDAEWLLAEIKDAQSLGHNVKPVIIGPLTYLWLGRGVDNALDLLPSLLACYEQLLAQLADAAAQWVQIDEPILGLDLPAQWRDAFAPVYNTLAKASGSKLLLATYFSTLRENLSLVFDLPVDGIHIDAVRGGEDLQPAFEALRGDQTLSVGVVNGRNVWKTDLAQWQQVLREEAEVLGDRLWISASCSLLHSPVDLETETGLSEEHKNKLAYSRQKLDELQKLRSALEPGAETLAAFPQTDSRTEADVRQQLESTWRPQKFSERVEVQRERWQLPLLPTTTIGSFPQTDVLRQVRKQFRNAEISQKDYHDHLRAEIAEAIRRQEILGLDVLVHGEAERNDMVEYFGEQLDGFIHTGNGWVQSYGSRCVKPPIIAGDISRPNAMTVQWSEYAQSLSKRPVKGMLTGPVTILNWSFPREDIPRAASCLQIAKALRDEVRDLEAAGIGIIQVDEPALREGLPLREAEHKAYFDWAVGCFRYTCSEVKPETQIHTHMCYSNFNAIMEAIVALDADVITIESARSDLRLLDVFAGENGGYPNEIGPGIYDIHSPNVPEREELKERLQQLLKVIPKEKLWVNPDCGLKTRNWAEVGSALLNMVEATRTVRSALV
ncbi:5-methyltetrahydropteroyltriglutamate--homocysteine S-methyltransferase [Microbulbifer agarilyticus]|uniref:5-methyltetrahydropteroyltriglutamate-- homocysteine S-methyltransferase n=1 Tax=Microbulbifer agarilyticus TaxID=260552 RepID=UPI001C963E9B|nr:5-methyltetrahydropteroyltriglutamate--homocysteine S-methyltransferase [Microbulbifer agarilyticus]MBY6190525.1 5-methyltetrahydropteroyltriglutamate--homocysteine S-methyltransferase [Microbulbifer agarilyticus]